MWRIVVVPYYREVIARDQNTIVKEFFFEPFDPRKS